MTISVRGKVFLGREVKDTLTLIGFRTSTNLPILREVKLSAFAKVCANFRGKDPILRGARDIFIPKDIVPKNLCKSNLISARDSLGVVIRGEKNFRVRKVAFRRTFRKKA